MDFKKLTLYTFFLPSCLFANTANVFFSGGPTVSKLNNTPFVQFDNFVVNNYQTIKKSEWNGFWGGGIGRTFKGFMPNLGLTLRFGGYAADLGHVSGIEYPFFNEGSFDPLKYHFHVKSSLFLFDAQLSYLLSCWEPFVLAGVGKAWNHLENYHEIPLEPALSASPSLLTFQAHTKQNVAWELGLGVQRLVYSDDRHHIDYHASIAYHYFPLGKGVLTLQSDELSIDGLQIKHLSTQGAIFSINASFN